MCRPGWARALALVLAPLHVAAWVRLDPADELPPARIEVLPPRWRLPDAKQLGISAQGPALGVTPSFLARREPAAGPQVSQLQLQDAAVQAKMQLEDAKLGIKQEANVQIEDARLRIENDRLRRSEASLRQERDWLRQDEAELRREDLELREEDSRLRRTLEKVLPIGPTGRRQPSALLGEEARAQQVKGGAIIVMVSLAIFSVLGVVIYNLSDLCADDDPVSDDEEDNDDSAEEAELKALMAKGGAQSQRSRSCCWCFFGLCGYRVAFFIVGVIGCSLAAGLILLKMGILQPMIGELMIYIYGVVIILSFISLVIFEMWRLARTVISYIMKEFRKIKSVFKFGFGRDHKKERGIKGLLDEGAYAPHLPFKKK